MPAVAEADLLALRGAARVVGDGDLRDAESARGDLRGQLALPREAPRGEGEVAHDVAPECLVADRLIAQREAAQDVGRERHHLAAEPVRERAREPAPRHLAVAVDDVHLGAVAEY